MTQPSSPLAQALIDARRQGRFLSPAQALALVPTDVAAAMRVQREVAVALGHEVAGWKTGPAPDGTPVAAPIYRAITYPSGATVRHGPLGKTGIEVEIALLLAKDLPPRPGRPYDRDDILAAAQGVFAGLEIVASRFEEPPKPPFLAGIADNIGNGGYVRGDVVRDARGLDLARLRTRLEADGRSLHDAIGGHALGDPLKVIVDYANRPCDLLGGLKAGQFVTTGTLSGCPYLEGTTRLTAEIEGLGKVELSLEP